MAVAPVWAQVVAEWERALSSPAAGDVAPRDLPGVWHVHVYALPVARDGSTVLQLRDRPAYSMGVFGGEVEMWDEGTMAAMQVHLADPTAAGVTQSLPPPVWVALQRELEEELGTRPEALTPRAVTLQRVVTKRSRWQVLAVLVVVDVADAETWCDLSTGAASCACDFGTETQAVIPIYKREDIEAVFLRKHVPLAPLHAGHLRTLAGLWRLTAAKKPAAAAAASEEADATMA